MPLRTKLTAAAFDVDCLDDRRLDESPSELRDRRGRWCTSIARGVSIDSAIDRDGDTTAFVRVEKRK